MRTSHIGIGLLTAAFTTAAFAAPLLSTQSTTTSPSPSPVVMAPLVHSVPNTEIVPVAPEAGGSASPQVAGSVASTAEQVDSKPVTPPGSNPTPGANPMMPPGGPMMMPGRPQGEATPVPTPYDVKRNEPLAGKGIVVPMALPTPMPSEDGPQRKDENAVDYMWRKSDVAFHLGDYERAISLHRAIAFMDPKDPENYGVGAWLIWSLGRKDEALAFIDQGLKADPDDWAMWNEAGEHNDLQHRYVDAAKDYAKAVQLLPKTEDSQMLRRRYAHASEKAGDLNTSIEVWKGLVESFPNEAVNKNNLARVEKLRPMA